MKEKRQRGIIYVALLSVFLLFVIGSIYLVIYKNIEDSRESEQFAELNEMQLRVAMELNSVSNLLIYFSHSELAKDSLLSSSDLHKKYLASLMQQMSQQQKQFDQLRLLDTKGNEIIRVNQGGSLPLIASPEVKLQNKSKRYYFQKALQLQAGQVYISAFDLNKEYGLIETPIKPMIRYATPIYSNRDVLLGVGVINYNGRDILQLIDDLNIHQGDEIFLINSDGYYLKANDSSKEWAFMYPEKKGLRFADEYPDIWQAMQKKESRRATNDKGEYYFSHFHLGSSLNAVNNESLFLVMHIPESIASSKDSLLIKGLMIGFFLLFPMLAILGWWLAKSQVEEKWLIKQLQFEARHDALTGLYNRKAIIELIDQNILISRRRKSPLAVGFIDVNDLKKTNDLLGHEAGDEMITGLAKVIVEVIRESDVAARIGGDEFLIVFIDCNCSEAINIMQRIQSFYSEEGLKTADKKWSISFGASELLTEQDTTDKIIERADAQMYKHKALYKQAKA